MPVRVQGLVVMVSSDGLLIGRCLVSMSMRTIEWVVTGCLLCRKCVRRCVEEWCSMMS